MTKCYGMANRSICGMIWNGDQCTRSNGLAVSGVKAGPVDFVDVL